MITFYLLQTYNYQRCQLWQICSSWQKKKRFNFTYERYFQILHYFPRSHHSSRSALQVWFGTDIAPDALPDVTLPIILAWDRNQEYTDFDLLRLYFRLLRESHCKPVSHERQMCYSLTMEKPYFTIPYFIIIIIIFIFIYINIIEA